ncbi:DNA-dependent ATPase fun30, partial [Coemansia sp. RSA 2603]
QPPPCRTLARRPAQHSVSLDGSDSDSESDDSEAVFERRFTDIEPHVLRLFNQGTAAELMADTGASADEAQIVMDLRPFADVDAVEQAMRRTRGVRLAMFNQVRDTLLGHAEVEQVIGQCSGIFAQLKNAMRSAGVQSNEATGAVSVAPGVTLRQPQMINAEFTLKHYQLEGVAWLSCLRDAGASGILADEMGLGKTFQVIAFICKGLEEARPALSHAFKARHGAKRSQTAAAPDSDEGVQTPDAAVSATEAQHINQAKTLLRPFVLRRRKCDVLGDLPTKTEHIVRLDLTPVQRTLYDSVRPDQDTDIQSRLMNLDAALQLDAAECSAKNAKDKSWISSFMDMRKVADHPLLLRSHYDDTALRKMARAILREPDYAEASYEYVLEDMEVCSDFELHKLSVTYPSLRQYKLSDDVLLDSAKVIKLREIVDECVARKEKVLVFSQFTTMLNVLEAVFQIWKIDYFRLDGQTKVDERQAMIDEYNSSESSVPVFLLSTKAGGFGINLTSANVVVIYDAGNNPSEERQAEDRAHRVGQVKDVRVYKLIGNNTIDEAIWENSQSKLLVEHMFWF